MVIYQHNWSFWTNLKLKNFHPQWKNYGTMEKSMVLWQKNYGTMKKKLYGTIVNYN